MNKKFSYIVINKSNMTELKHFKTAEQTTDFMFNFNKRFNADNWIVIKNEATIVDLTPMNTYGGDLIS